MNSCIEEEPLPAPWVAVVVQPRAERKVQTGLANLGVETFVPWHGVRRGWSDRVKILDQNLFPGYVFCRSTFSERQLVLNQPGVKWVVSFDRIPALIPDVEILSLRRAVQSGLALGLWPFLKAGQPVRIEEGALAGIEGTLLRDSTAWRVVLSINALHRSVAVQVDRDMIRMVSRPMESARRVDRTIACRLEENVHEACFRKPAQAVTAASQAEPDRHDAGRSQPTFGRPNSIVR
jgi:transcription antitermination factor NusG